jgi:hypothetical protein
MVESVLKLCEHPALMDATVDPVDASSTVAAFALDCAQMEQARVSIRWQAPPSAY